MKSKFKKVMLFWELYYPIILAFFSFLYSVSLWFSGQKLEGIFVGIWVPSMLLDKEDLESIFIRKGVTLNEKENDNR